MQAVRKQWQLLSHNEVAIGNLARILGISPVLAQVLLNRGLEDPVQAKRFLEAPLSGLHPPATLPGVPEAVERLCRAIESGKRITIYGDYDVDGTTGTAILWQLFRQLGNPAEFYVPHRLEEGYGLNVNALRQEKERGAEVIVTVDCGISALEEADEARRLGIELIVTDHHEMRQQLPNAAALVHPRLPGTAYPFGGLSGSGVAFKLAWAIAQKMCGSEKVTPKLRELLLDGVGLAALGLVADAVPLQDENRIFVRHGLARLREKPLPGIKALLEEAKIAEGRPVTAEDVGFKLAPRLNAMGRLGSARLVVELLTTTSAPRAADLARVLEGQNTKRQQKERQMLAQAREMAEDYDSNKTKALVLAHAEWHPGIVGIVASRLVDRFHKPVVLIALYEDQTQPGKLLGHGSGRSIPNYPLHEALEACTGCLLSHGGHAAAAGLRILPELIDEFRDRLNEHANRLIGGQSQAPTIRLDAEIPLASLTTNTVNSLDRLEPFGMDNKRPILLASNLRVSGEPKSVGNGERHLSFEVSQSGTRMRAIAFNMAERKTELLSEGGACCLAFSPKINEWNGRIRIDLEVVDFQAGPDASLI